MENEVTTTSEIPKTPEGIKGWIGSVLIATSQTVVGQSLFKLVDSFLWVIEKSAQWSLPPQEIEAEDNGKVFGKMKLIRPLPWFLFLPGLVILRIIRSTINVGAYIFGYQQIQPSGMVKFVQKNRRRLRALNLKIAKSVRRSPTSKDKRLTMIEAKKALIRSIRLTLSTLSCLDTSKSLPSPPPTKIRISHTDLEPVATPDEKSTTESVDSPIQHESKRKFSQLSSNEENTDESDSETLNVKLERFAMEDSADDLDFNLATCSTEINTASSSVSSDEADKDVSLTELKDIQKEATEFLRRINTLTPLEAVTSSLEKLEGTPDGEKNGVDSSGSDWQKALCGSKEIIDPEVTSTSEQFPTDSTPSSDILDRMFIENQKELATSELSPAQESCELSPAQEPSEIPPAQEPCELPPAPESCELPQAQEPCELPPAQESCELRPAPESCELPQAQEPCELPPAQESCELQPTSESCELPPAQESCELRPTPESCQLPPAQEPCELPPAQESCELQPTSESCELPPAQESCQLQPTSESCELPPAQEPCELPPAQEPCELPPAQESRELSPAANFRELPPAANFRELPLAAKFRRSPPAAKFYKSPPTLKFRELPPALIFCELRPAPESRELPPAPESRELPPAQKSCEFPPAQESCELLPAAGSCELPLESCELRPTLESCELTPTQKSCELLSAPESCELPPAPECRELPPGQKSWDLPSTQKPCEFTPGPETCTSAETRSLDTKEFPHVQEKMDHKTKKLEHHRNIN